MPTGPTSITSAKSGWKVTAIACTSNAKVIKTSCYPKHSNAVTGGSPFHTCVDYVFADMAQLGGKMPRSSGLACATLHLKWKVATYNLHRLCYLKEAISSAFWRPHSVWATGKGLSVRENECYKA